jgi:trk system potassium uptake protein TrkH
MRFIGFVNGIALMTFAVLMGLDALIFRATSEAFLTSAVTTGMVGVFLALATRSSDMQVERLHTFLLTSSVWLTAAIAGAVPLYAWELTPADAFFEAMSGITTTGSTVMAGLDTTPNGIIFWRAMLQAIGGIGFIVTGIALLPFLRVGGMQLFRTESSDKGANDLNSAAMFALVTLRVYFGLMILCAIVYRIGGMTFFDAITHAMTTLSTGGYSGHDASFGYFQSPFLQWSATLFMLAGALPFAWYVRVLVRSRFRSDQVIAMIQSLAVVIFVAAAWLVLTHDIGVEEALRLVAFNVVSVVTTTGFATTDYTLWGSFAVALFFVLTAVGGCTGSTAGGVKALRWLLTFRSIASQIRTVDSPHQIVPVRLEGKRVADDVISSVIAFGGLFFVTFAVLSLILTLLGLDLVTASSGALTALANVGPGVGPIIGPAGNFSTLNDAAKITLSVGMYLGRLELMTVLVLFLPVFWREVL